MLLSVVSCYFFAQSSAAASMAEATVPVLEASSPALFKLPRALFLTGSEYQSRHPRNCRRYQSSCASWLTVCESAAAPPARLRWEREDVALAARAAAVRGREFSRLVVAGVAASESLPPAQRRGDLECLTRGTYVAL